MKDLLKLVLRSQTVLGLIPFAVLVVSDFGIFGFQQSINADDREVFNCIPRLNVSFEERCYHNYTSDTGLKFYVFLAMDGLLFAFWIITMVKSTKYLWKIKQNGLIQNEETEQSVNLNSPLNWTPNKFRKMQLNALGCQLFAVGLTTLHFCIQYYFIESKFQFSSPTVYKCELYSNDPTPVRFNQTFSCFDQHYKERADFNIATVVIKLFIMVLYLINFIYIAKLTLAKKLLDNLLAMNLS